MANTVNESAIKKLKLLFTVVDRPKAEFYMDVLSQFEVNCQMLMSGSGTANSQLVDMLGLNLHKAVILSVVREDLLDLAFRAVAEATNEAVLSSMLHAKTAYGLNGRVWYSLADFGLFE